MRRSLRFVIWMSAVGCGLLLGAIEQTVAADPSVLLQRGDAQLSVNRVEIVVEAAGELTFREKEATKSLPTQVAARLAYEEKRLAKSHAGSERSARAYRTAEAKIQVEKESLQPKLAEERNVVVVESTEAQPLLFSPFGPLTTDELELLQVPFNSLLVDRLLPNKTTAVGEAWTHDNGLITAMLNLDAVSGNDMSSKLVGIDAESARVEFQGSVQGALGGVATEFEVTGRYKFDLKTKQISWLAALLKEKRAIGHVEPGVTATTRVQMIVAPTVEPEELVAANLRDLPLEPQPELVRLAYASTPGKFRLEHDRRWHVMADAQEVLALRMVDRGELVAQCNVRPIELPDPQKRPTLSQFQADVRRSLDAHFRQFAAVGESQNSLGQTIFRAEAVGTVEELEIHWIYYLVCDPTGRQVVLAFTVEEPMLERLGKADIEIVGTIRFLADTATAGRPTPAPATR